MEVEAVDQELDVAGTRQRDDDPPTIDDGDVDRRRGWRRQLRDHLPAPPDDLRRDRLRRVAVTQHHQVRGGVARLGHDHVVERGVVAADQRVQQRPQRGEVVARTDRLTRAVTQHRPCGVGVVMADRPVDGADRLDADVRHLDDHLGG
jgi:hypothetical protein